MRIKIIFGIIISISRTQYNNYNPDAEFVVVPALLLRSTQW